MTDLSDTTTLVDRLIQDHGDDTRQDLINLCVDAADEIDRLRARVAQLEAALQKIVDRYDMGGDGMALERIARAALKEGTWAKLEEALREAFRAGFLAAVGPANEAEYDELAADEQTAWETRRAALKEGT